jgi:hypothetical protein
MPTGDRLELGGEFESEANASRTILQSSAKCSCNSPR